MVRGVRSQTDLEEEGASCQVLARHALARWIQARRWAWGEWTPVTPNLNNHHHHKTSFLGPSMFELNLPQRPQGQFLPLGRSRMCLSILLFFVIKVSFEQLLSIWMLKSSDLFHTKGLRCSLAVPISPPSCKKKIWFLPYLWTALTSFTSL